MILGCLLIVCTALYITYSAFQDLRERMIYCVPCNLLTITWGIWLWQEGNRQLIFLLGFWLVHVLIYVFMNHLGVWGGGDSDFLFLFANVSLFAFCSANAYEIAIAECICLCIALFMSIGIGWMEGKHKQIRVDLKSNVAVVPGMAVMMVVLMAKGMIERCCL